jgi:2,3-bisphosphoglycerate-independent phosphoglycerate mutase
MRGPSRTICWLVLDGVADRPAAALDGQTPLEAAETPTLDRLAAAGCNGIMDVARPGTPLSSDRAHAILFGYDPAAVPGRGVLEARGLGVSVPERGVACSASFARVSASDRGWTVTDRHPSGSDEEFERLAAGLPTVETDGATASFAFTWKNRGIVVLRPTAGPLSPAVTDVDPFDTGLPVVAAEPLAAAEDAAAAERTAAALRQFTRESVAALADAPVDAVLSKWAGTQRAPPAFAQRHGLEGCSLTAKPVLQGLAETLGLAVETPPAAYDDRPPAVASALDNHDFVHVHYPEPDEVSHAADPAAKREEIAAIDASLAPLVDRALTDDGLVTVVTADHTTPSAADVVHAGDPVPVTVVGDGVRTDDVAAVGERPASAGGLGRIRGRDLLRLSRAAADRVLLDGLRRTPAVPDYPSEAVTALTRRDR